MTKDKALKMAIEVMENIEIPYDKFAIEAIQACKEELEQPAMTYEDGFAHGYEAHRAEQALKKKNT